jgi:hypothetical protein
LGTISEWRRAPNPEADAFLWGDPKNLTDGHSERSERFEQDSLGGARKAEGASGAGRPLTPEAVPSNGKEMEERKNAKRTRLFEWSRRNSCRMVVPVMLGDPESSERYADGVVHATMPVRCMADRFAGATESEHVPGMAII